MSAFRDAATQLRAVLEAEVLAARQARLQDLVQLIDRKRQAVAALSLAGTPQSSAEREALVAMLRAAEENALALGAVAGALDMVRTRLRQDVSAAADAGLYERGMAGRKRRLRHTLAAQFDHTA